MRDAVLDFANGREANVITKSIRLATNTWASGYVDLGLARGGHFPSP